MVLVLIVHLGQCLSLRPKNSRFIRALGAESGIYIARLCFPVELE